MKLDLFQNRQKGEKFLGTVNKRPKPVREPKADVKLIMFNEVIFRNIRFKRLINIPNSGFIKM